MSTGINIDKSIKVVDETTPITDSASQLTFTGAGVTATGSGGNVTINIPGGSTGSVTNVTGVSPIASSGGNTPAISISDAEANGTTKGAATFTANDFNSASGVISLDYANGQKASASQDGFLSLGDYSTFSGKQNTITGGASTITTSNLSPSFALQSNASGKVEVSTVTSTELGYVSGVTSSIQTQLNSKQNALVNPVTGTGASGQVSFWSGTNTQSGSNNLFWDNTNGRLGIGTVSPTTAIDVNGTARVQGVLTSVIGASTTNTYLYNIDITQTGNIQSPSFPTMGLSIYGTYTDNNTINNTIYNPFLNVTPTIAFGATGGLAGVNRNFINFSPIVSGAGKDVVQSTNILNITPSFTNRNVNNITGIYYNPTFTLSGSNTNHRAIETTSGDVLFGSNFIWNNANGNLALGGTANSTDRLYVKATTTSASDFAIKVQDSLAATNLFTINNAGSLVMRNRSLSGEFTLAFNANNTLSFGLTAIGTFMTVGSSPTLTNVVTFGVQQIQANTRGAQFASTDSNTPNAVTINGIPSLSSGTTPLNSLLISPAINNTGAYVGTVRGLYYNPTLTSLTGTTHRAIETTAGDVLFGSNFFWDNTNGRLGIGTSTPDSPLNITSSNSASSSVGRIVNIASTLTATANNDVLVGLDINPTFSVGAFTGTTQIALRLFGSTTAWHGTQFTNGGIRCTGSGGGSGGISLDSSAPVANRLNFNNNFTIRSNSSVTSGVDISLFTNSVQNLTNTVSLVGISGNVLSSVGGNNQTNGLLISPNINLVAGNVATIFRGIHYNPTLTSQIGLTTHRAIETAVGDVIFNSTSGNVAIGGTSFGTSANKVLAVYSGTAPASSPLDSFQMYSADIVSGNAAPHFRTENGTTIKLYQNTAVTTAQGIATALTNLGVLATSTIPQSGYTLIFGHNTFTYSTNTSFDIGSLTYDVPTNSASNLISRRYKVPKTGIVKRVSIMTTSTSSTIVSASPSPTIQLFNFTTSTATTITTTNLYYDASPPFARNDVFSINATVTEGDEITIRSIIGNVTTPPQSIRMLITLWIEET